MRYRFLILIPIFQFVLAEASSSKPTAIIQAICWDQFTSKNLHYFPWGNDAESNSTNLPLSVGFSIPSQPIAYYGKSPIKFFELDTSLVDPGLNNNSDPQFSQVAEFNFDARDGDTVNFFLLLLKKKNSNELKIYPISLDQGNLPFGSFNCYSQCQETLYIAFGNQKQVLAPGKSVRFQKEKDRVSKVTIYTRRDGKYAESISEPINLGNDRRAIIFLSNYKNRPSIKRYYFNRVPIENSIGYDSQPFIVTEEELVEQNSSNESKNISY